MENQCSNMNNNKAVFFDRDGVINKERKDYVKTVDELELFPGIATHLKKLKEAGFLLAIVTNQSAINRGLTNHKNVQEIHMTIQNFLNRNGTSIDGFYVCPHRPDEGCQCRKPEPGLLFEAARELHINLKSSWFIGDKESDILASKKAGCMSLKIDTSMTFENAVNHILQSET